MVERGSARTIAVGTSVVPTKLVTACGVADCAAVQTGHFAASRAPECWWVTTATAATRVSSRQRHAMCFEKERIL